MGRQFRRQGDKVVYQRPKKLIRQTAHLEMELMQMEGQKEKARGWQGRI